MQVKVFLRWRPPRDTLQNKLFDAHQEPPGHPIEEEATTADAINQIVDWGFPVAVCDDKDIVQKYLSKQARTGIRLSISGSALMERQRLCSF